MNRRLILIPFAFLIGAVVWFFIGKGSSLDGSGALPFPGLVGPASVAMVPAVPAPTPWQRYESGAPSSLAILLTDTKSPWLGLAHGLKSNGVPFQITTDVNAALRHRVIVVYPALTGASLPATALSALAAHVHGGGSLIGFDVEGGGMPALFGFDGSLAASTHTRLDFTRAVPLTTLRPDERETSIRLAAPSAEKAAAENLRTLAYLKPQQPAIATYEDGSAAITQRDWGAGKSQGHAYAIGIDFGHFLLRAHNGRSGELARSYVNDFEPTLDVLVALLETLYRRGEPDAVTLYAVPQNKNFAALITHDIDFTRSMVNAVAYAEFERSQGVDATYFVQTKYLRDYNDDVFFNEEGVRHLQRLTQLGMEIASHTITHSRVFNRLAMGSGDERYPTYRPRVVDPTTVRDATLLGELRVSKFLLEHFSGQTVISFRPGHLSYPFALPQALGATGYRYSSSITANDALTHLPYRLMDNRDYASETGLFEFPVTIEDEAGRLGDRLPEAITLARKIGRYGGCVNILIHPDVLDHKLEFEKAFVRTFRNEAWFGSLRTFAEWWAARDQVTLSVVASAPLRRTLTIEVPVSIDGLTLQLPPGWRYVGKAEQAKQDGNRLVLARSSGRGVIEFALTAQ